MPCARCGELVEYLSLHGVGASAREIDAGTRPVADVLLESAAASGAGLLVLGGYGHSRWRELFVSGTTSRAIQQANLPLFLVH
jgi:nucleotide-binding universal stress UspA family protein